MTSRQLEKILYVEDEPDIQAVAQIALESVGGFQVHLCSSGEQALEDIQGVAPDLLLLDVMMPGMDGPTTLSRIRELPGCADIPVIFMTAKVQPDEVEGFRALGAIDVIPKPFDPMTLADNVREIWARHGD